MKEEKLQMARVSLQRAIQINPANTVLLCQLAVIEQALHSNDSVFDFLVSKNFSRPCNVWNVH